MVFNPLVLPCILRSSSLDHLLEGIQHDSVLVRAQTYYSKMNLVAKRILLGNLFPPVSPVDILSVLFKNPYLDYFNSYRIGFCKHLRAILVPEKDAVLPLNSPPLCSSQLESWPAILSYRIPPTFYCSCQWHIISWYFNWHFLPWLLSYFSDVLGRLLIGFLSGCAPGWSRNYADVQLASLVELPAVERMGVLVGSKGAVLLMGLLKELELLVLGLQGLFPFVQHGPLPVQNILTSLSCNFLSEYSLLYLVQSSGTGLRTSTPSTAMGENFTISHNKTSWIGCICAEIARQHLQLIWFSWKLIPMLRLASF
ncbi:unnamed protein product [Prunus brigantina]